MDRTHVIELDGPSLGDWQFREELINLLHKVQGVTDTRPIIITVQIGNTRWVWNSNTAILPE